MARVGLQRPRKQKKPVYEVYSSLKMAETYSSNEYEILYNRPELNICVCWSVARKM